MVAHRLTSQQSFLSTCDATYSCVRERPCTKTRNACCLLVKACSRPANCLEYVPPQSASTLNVTNLPQPHHPGMATPIWQDEGRLKGPRRAKELWTSCGDSGPTKNLRSAACIRTPKHLKASLKFPVFSYLVDSPKHGPKDVWYPWPELRSASCNHTRHTWYAWWDSPYWEVSKRHVARNAE